MSDNKARLLVIKRIRHNLAVFDEETNQPLSGQSSVVVESRDGEPPKVTITFDAWGSHGIRFEDDPRQEID
ncbi:hypothetical protein [Acinetobacter johnsonii]|uniref:Uncharacterized protein n=1 Tax=Acinetobacter johnsonii TaxID=40214 RepID=A0A380U2M1_ACIJO|nr:hypothetical protein [Acinetobacter johnsonii]ENU39298.1 hypothetical protein F986_02082 [Acinetobacter johnsonii CIP 64.6]QPS04846.1 hypothetical protein I6G67_05135 [Acinetobacter johnsonii]SUT95428.1 Uncharacterised protein [Acinetobacter johnsonii]